MENPSPPTNPIEALVTQARQTAASAGHTPFSPAAFETLQQKIEQYITDLVLESVRVMNRRQADTVSPSYVQQANDNLVSGTRRRRYTLIGTVGGVLLGAGASSAVEMVRTGSVTVPGALIVFALATCGAFMIALQFSRE